jgi:prolipoprotein diacylglyceryl transferase
MVLGAQTVGGRRPVPSPPSPTFTLGPLSGRWYGLLVGLAAAVFVLCAAALWRRRGGRWEHGAWLALAALPAALAGARLYHLATGGGESGADEAAVWEGGLGIFGAVAGGALALLGGARLLRLDGVRLLDCAVPGLAAGQALGRVGNWFNQELYGGPTSLPWGLEIDPEHRLPGYEDVARYHPAFLYEALWDLALAALLWRLVAGRPPARRGVAAGVWLAGYGLGRLWIEGLRLEPATELGPLRLNQVVALGCVVAGATVVLRAARTPRASPR